MRRFGDVRGEIGGRGTYRIFAPEYDAKAKHRRQLELDLRLALDRGELEIHYQPLVDLASYTVTACEALLRWHHPERGMISPADFIPVAEETGLISEIGEWVLKQACQEAASWPSPIGIAALDQSARTRQRRDQAANRSVGIFPNEDAITRLIGAILLEQNDEWAVQRGRYMTLETIAPLGDYPAVSFPAIAS
jgi:predicted signal transduction protein with EAL and GGDEF domain